MSAITSVPAPVRRLLGDALLIARGTVFGQALFVLVMPLITRLYPPTELGLYGLALAFVGIAAPVAGLRFELAAISARDRDDARALLLLSAFAILPITCLGTALLCGLKLLGLGAYNALPWWMVAATAAIVAASGAYSTLRCWLVRHHRFRLVATSLTVQGCVRGSIPVALAPMGASAALLMTGELVSRLSAVGLMLRHGALRAAWRALRTPAHALRERANRFWKYPVLLGPSALIDAAAIALPVPVLASCYGLPAAGKFALVQRLVMLPAVLIVGSVGDVFHAHAAAMALQQPAATAGFIANTAARLLLFAVAVYLPLALLAPFTAGWVFGIQWADAGAMIAVLAPTCIAQTVVSPLSRALLISGREEQKLIADIVFLLVPISTLYLASSSPLIVAIGCFSAASVLSFAVYYVVIRQALGGGVISAGSRR
ncbi:MAG TPA: oligosaccharide flippase family protein [Steroidobacteraceae bacterium]|nr:oligosaccharide flippase family protein [Steroidobacteraceae bacterium]